MCRWHKHVAKSIATDITQDGFDVGRYSIALVAMGTQRVEQTAWGLQELHSIDGFNPEEILTPECQKAFEKSAAYTSLTVDEIQNKLDDQISVLNQAMDQLSSEISISKQDLGITDRITKDGYKQTCCATPNPRENGPQLDAAVVYLVKGYDDDLRDVASKELEVISNSELKALRYDPTVRGKDMELLKTQEPIRHAVERYVGIDGVKEALRTSFSLSVAYIFKTAPDDLKNGTGLSGASDCIMCEGVKGRAPS